MSSTVQTLRKMSTRVAFLSTAIYFVLFVAAPAIAQPAIIPAPAKIEQRDGAFDLRADTPIVATGKASEAADYFIDLMRRTRGIELERKRKAQRRAKAIVFELQPTAIDVPSPSRGALANGDERYRIDVSSQAIKVSAPDRAGLFYGGITLWQLFTSRSGSLSAPAVQIEDGPRFAWRGLMLDSARHFQSIEFIKRFIDTMAQHKLSIFHWHLVDDQAWRIEIKKYPELTAKGAWRVPAGAAQRDIDPNTGKPRLYGGYYTQDQIRDVVAYARARHITVVPEIEMPGHATAAIVAYPKLAATSTPPTSMPADWGIYPHLFNVEEETFAFLQDVLMEVMALFPSPYIHVGGDEAVKEQWQASPRVQARMRELGVEDEHALQSYFIQRMEKFLSAHGRRLIGWDEILEGGLAPNATVMSWRGIDGAVAAATAGHDTVLSSWPTLYFDNRQNAFDWQPGRGRVIGLEEVYRFDPSPAQIQSEQRKHILGVQANLWTEHMRSEARVEHMAFPRAAAIAEIAWTPAERLDWPSFQQRIDAQLERYAALGIRYAPKIAPTVASDTVRRSHELRLCSDKLPLSLEDDAPISGARETFLVDVMQPCWIFPSVDLSRFDAIEVQVGQVPFNFQIGKDRDAIKFAHPRTETGELEVRATCEGPVIATLPLAPARGQDAVTRLPAAKLSGEGVQDLCFTFTQHTLDPLWVVHRVRLHEKASPST